MNQCRSRIVLLFYLLSLSIIFYTFSRSVFFVLNYNLYQGFGFYTLFLSFLSGIRFDLSSLIFINTPLILFSLIPYIPKKLYTIVASVLFFALNIPFYIINLIDTEYYKFTGRRITAEVFAFSTEASNQLGQFLYNYWHIFIITFISTSFFILKAWKYINKNNINLNLAKTLVLGPLVLVVCVFAARGGLQKKPIKISHAYTSSHEELGDLKLNSSFTLLHSFYEKGLTKKHYFKNQQELVEILKPTRVTASPSNLKNTEKENVVLIILESFATEFWGIANNNKGYTPFLDSLAKKSLFFKNNFANGKRSIEALPSILYGIPALMNRPLAISTYQLNDYISLPEILNKEGYHTSFFHGAKKGTMYFDAIAARAGFKEYFPLESYPKVDSDFDGRWGIYDEPFLQFMLKKINTFPEPFFANVFTISSHQPYTVPDKYKNQFKGGTSKIHRSIEYVDYALQKFFEEAKKQPWYDKTLFVITADHTQMSGSISEKYNSSLGRFMVPLLFYHPQSKIKAEFAERITQHSDVMISILDYLNIPNEKLNLFGHSVFDKNTEGEALLYLSDNYWLINKNHFIQSNPNQNSYKLYLFEDKKQKHVLNDPNLLNALSQKVRAYIQYHNNSLIEDSLYIKAK